MQDETQATMQDETGPQDGGEGAAESAASEDPAEQVGESITQGLDSIGDRVSEFAENPTLDTAVEAFGPLVIDVGLGIVGFIVLIVVVSFVSRWAQRLARAGLKRLHLEPTVVSFLAKVAKYAVWVLALPVALEIFGIETTSFVTAIGAAGLAIGLAMQGALSNIAAGIMLLVLRPFKIGDWVELDDEFGIVRDIGIFYTLIDTFQNKLVYLPNGEVLGAKIEHYTANESRRMDVPVGVAYGTDLKEAMRVLEAAAEEVSDSPREEDKPSVILTTFGGSSIDFDVRVWCASKDYLHARTKAVFAIEKALADAGIEIPFPQRTLTFGGRLGVETGAASD